MNTVWHHVKFVVLVLLAALGLRANAANPPNCGGYWTDGVNSPVNYGPSSGSCSGYSGLWAQFGWHTQSCTATEFAMTIHVFKDDGSTNEQTITRVDCTPAATLPAQGYALPSPMHHTILVTMTAVTLLLVLWVMFS